VPFLAPQLFLLSFAFLLPWLQYFRSVSRKSMGWFALIGALFALGFGVAMTRLVPGANFIDAGLMSFGSDGFKILGGALVVDQFSVFFQLIFTAAAVLAIAGSLNYVADDPNVGEFYSLVLIATVGMNIVAMGRDLFAIYAGIEVASIASVALAAFRKRDAKSVEAGAKFLIISGVSSAMALFGLSLVYGIAGTTSIDALGSPVIWKGQLLASPLLKPGFEPVVIIAIVFLVAGFGFKITAVPFHAWAPDTYEGAPTPVTAYLSAASTKVGFAAMFYIFVAALFALKAAPAYGMEIMIGGVAVASMTLGNLLAIAQANLKRMLAYSSVAQVGYILIAVAVGTEHAVAAGLFYLLVHVFMKGGAFFVVAMLGSHVGETVDSYKGLRYRSTLGALAMTVFLLSLAGVPPLGGFVAKWFVFSSAIEHSQLNPGNLAWVLAVAGILNSALSLYYYLRVVKNMYVLGEEDRVRLERFPVPEDRALQAAVIACFVMVFMLGLFPSQFYAIALDAAGALVPASAAASLGP
jgi:NADH-quinone oxidoreductase subunit N